MAFNPRPLLERLHTFLAASGRCPAGSGIGEPKNPPNTGTGVYGAVMLGPMRLTELSLATGSGVIVLMVRLYRDALKEPLDETEFLMGQTAMELIEDFAADFDFGVGTVRNFQPLDWLATPGYQDIGGTMYRVLDMTVPVMVNDLVTFTA